MSLAVSADNTAAIDGKHHRQLLNGDVVDQLIVSALQEGGINCYHRLITANGQTGGEGHRVLFGNRHVKILLRIVARELHHARAFTHGRGDGHQRAVLGGGFTQPVAKNF
ncbi:hypothetical protein D3C78_1271600 [compost metagenome]